VNLISNIFLSVTNNIFKDFDSTEVTRINIPAYNKMEGREGDLAFAVKTQATLGPILSIMPFDKSSQKIALNRKI
jgi:hypothetical protein